MFCKMQIFFFSLSMKQARLCDTKQLHILHLFLIRFGSSGDSENTHAVRRYYCVKVIYVQKVKHLGDPRVLIELFFTVGTMKPLSKS